MNELNDLFENGSDAFRALNQAAMDPDSPYAKPDPKKVAKRIDGLEKDFQHEVECWIHLRGYWRRNKEWLTNTAKPKRGWQFHLNPMKTKGNPYVLDIILLANTGRFTEFELKLTGRPYSSYQQQWLCEYHGLPKFETLGEVVDHVVKWEEAA